MRTNYVLLEETNITLTELEHMRPWERDIYILLYKDRQETKKQIAENSGETQDLFSALGTDRS